MTHLVSIEADVESAVSVDIRLNPAVPIISHFAHEAPDGQVVQEHFIPSRKQKGVSKTGTFTHQ